MEELHVFNKTISYDIAQSFLPEDMINHCEFIIDMFNFDIGDHFTNYLKRFNNHKVHLLEVNTYYNVQFVFEYTNNYELTEIETLLKLYIKTMKRKLNIQNIIKLYKTYNSHTFRKSDGTLSNFPDDVLEKACKIYKNHLTRI